ncbi:MAG: NADH-quinone oxidoreductase subunit A [Hydrogenibacillus schlegelii]|nr:NADH-quinone oxidoreductase subunit A [Hydrogenibacillus schlegelii]
MESHYWSDYLLVAWFIALGVGLPLVAFGLARLIRPHRPYPEKLATYESGVEPFGTSRVRFRAHYYLTALLFVLFDVEVLFLYPWAVAFGQAKAFAFVEGLVFLGLIGFALFYAWRKGALEWK